MPSVTTAAGLVTSINELEVPEGSLLRADNCVIRSKNVIEPRRGFFKNSYNYGGVIGPGNTPEPSNQGFFYQDKLHVIYKNGTESRLAYDTGTAFVDYAGLATFGNSEYFGADETLMRLKSAVFRNNLYLATRNGGIKVSNVGSTPALSGVPQALSYISRTTGDMGSLGRVSRTGSTVTVSYNTLGAGASGAAPVSFYPGEVVYATSSDANFPAGSKTVVRDIPSGVGQRSFTYSEAGSAVTSAASVVYETQVLVDSAGFLADGNHCAYRFVLDLPDNNQQILLGPPSDKFVVANVSGTTGWVTTESKNVQLKIRLPAGLPANARLWIYRSEQVATTIPTSEDMYKIYERALSASDLANRVVIIKDIVLDSLLSEVLYTSPTAETSLSANFDPPWSKDIASWSNRLWYANTKGNYSKSIRVIGELPDEMFFLITSGSTSESVVAETTASAVTGINDFFVPTSGGSVTTRLRQAALNIVEAINRFSALVYAFYDEDLDTGIGFIRLESQNNAAFTIVAKPASGASGEFRTFIDPVLPLAASGNGGYSNSTRSLTRADNVVTVFNAGTVYPYISGDKITISNAVDTSFNGTFTLLSVVTSGGATTLTYAQTAANASTTGTVAYAGPYTDAAAIQETNTNRLFYSKLQQGEAVPLLNYLDIGAPGKQILRIIPLRERLYVFKEDGIFTIAGEYPFRVDLLDDTAKLLAADTCAIVGNQIFCLTSQGIVSVGEAGVAIVSRSWETELFVLVQQELYDKALYGTDKLVKSWGCGYESDRNYFVSVGESLYVYVYNYLNKVWTRWERAQNWGALHPTLDKLYCGNRYNQTVDIERKTMYNFSCDYADNKYTRVISTATIPDSLGRATQLTLTVAGPTVGDLLFSPGVQLPGGITELEEACRYDPTLSFFEVATVVAVNPANAAIVTVEYIGGSASFGFADNETIYVYQKYPVTLKWNALNGGQPALVKQFEEWSPVFNARSFRNATISFGADAQSNDNLTSVVNAAPFFNDGRTEQELSTERINPISKRVAIPRAQQRATNLTVTFVVEEACAYWRLLGFNYEGKSISNLANRKK